MSMNQSLAKHRYAGESGGTVNVAALLVDATSLRGRGGKSCRGWTRILRMILGRDHYGMQLVNIRGLLSDYELNMIGLGSTLTLRSRNNTAPLMEAAKGGHARVICLLLDMEAVVPDAVYEHRHTNNALKSVFGTAVQNGHAEVVRVLLTVGGATPDLESPFQAVEKGNLGMVQLMLITGNFKPGTSD
ncbi:unnamed protein product [Fusarium fujikuroi]|nr:unnamed protein product [Fusarium fujikuroi]